uniref:YncE family protein n=1 Tax=candidate division WOR-3 bacterium TaxID=2052148 RepID=A0A7C4CBK2_UNCW3
MRYRLPAALLLVVSMVMCRKWDNPKDPINNRPPNVPSLPAPDSGQVDVDTGVTLRWRGGDPDTERVFYDVHFGPSLSPPKVCSLLADTFFRPGRLSGLTNYYWRVVARDSLGDSAAGRLWSFRTALANSAPNLPSDPSPDSGATGVWLRARLDWACSDPNPGDTVFYDVCFGANPTPPVVSTRQRTTSYQPPRLSYDSTYYWRIIAQDNHGAVTTGPVWSLRACSPITITAPGAGARWTVGSSQTIRWSGGPTMPTPDTVVVYYSTNGGANWLRHGVATMAGQYDWQTPGPPSSNARVQVRMFLGADTCFGSSANFITGEISYPDTVVATVTVGARPKALVWDSIDNRVFCANYEDSSVTVIDGVTNSAIRTIRVGKFPTALLWVPGANKVFCANYLDSSVTVIDAAMNQVVGTIRTGPYPTALCFNETDNKVYVANYRGLSVTVINAATNQVITTVPVDTGPTALCWNRNVNKVYVANWTAGTVSIIDGSSDQVLRTVPVVYAPCALVVDNRNNVLVAPRQITQQVKVISGTTNEITATIGVGQEPWALSHNSTGDFAYCVNSADGTVSVIDCSGYYVTTTRSVSALPRSVVWAGWVNKVYVGGYGGSYVTILDGTSHSQLKLLAVGGRPLALCVNPTSNKVYVANYDSGTVSVIGSPE